MDEPRSAELSGLKQPYHLVDPSPWPIIGAAAAGTLALGGVFFMHNVTPWLLPAAFMAVLLVMAVWWWDVTKEAVRLHKHGPVVKIGFRYGMVLFITSEVMFFVAFFWAFFNASLYPVADIHNMWPPPGIQPVEAFGAPFMMTLILLLSGTTVTWAHHAILQGQQQEAAKALAVTILLGLFFTAMQAYEYAHAEFGFRQGIYPSTFFMATGFHGFHVIIGTTFLIVCWFRTMAGHFTPRSHFGFEAAAWYWHFVDVVWLFLFTSIYWWGHGHPVGG